jgi:SAM-dependent methyltransferase
VSAASSIAGPWWSVFRNPAFIARRRLASAIASIASHESVRGAGVLVDVGCGSKPYEPLFDVGRYVGVDVEVSGHPEGNKRCDVFFDGTTLPFDDGSCDVVLCTQALEHSPAPEALLAEIARVTRPGGVLALTAPFVWEEHETPYDFFRFTSFGVARIVATVGFEIIEQHRSCGSSEALAQATSVYLHRAVGRSVPGWSALVTALLCAPVQLWGMLWEAILPEAGNLFLDSVVLARRTGEVAS